MVEWCCQSMSAGCGGVGYGTLKRTQGYEVKICGMVIYAKIKGAS